MESIFCCLLNVTCDKKKKKEGLLLKDFFVLGQNSNFRIVYHSQKFTALLLDGLGVISFFFLFLRGWGEGKIGSSKILCSGYRLWRRGEKYKGSN